MERVPHGSDRCDKCGAPLKLVPVRRAQWNEAPTVDGRMTRTLVGYEDTEEYGDCIRCHGAY